jgi:hypothetical protein
MYQVNFHASRILIVHQGGVMGSILAIGPEVRGVQTGRRDGF